MLVTANTTKSIKAKAAGALNNPYQTERGRITDSSARGKNLKTARKKELNQLFIGGQRLQSTSDARFDNAVDYLLAALELQSMKGGAQVYTKVPGAVAFFNICKMCTNMSMMPKGGGLDASGNPVDTEVGGMALATMVMLRKQNEYAGSITIGVNDAHIRALMKQEFRDFIIPYHASGGKMSLIEYFRQVQDPDLKGTTIRSSDYTKTQSDKILSDELLRSYFGKTEQEIEDIHKFRDTRLWILTAGKSGTYYSDVLDPYAEGLTESQSNVRTVLQELYASMQADGKWNGVQLAKGKVEHQIFPNEFWDTNSTYNTSSVNTQRYLDYCDALGFLHRFSGKTISKGQIIPVTGYDQNGNKVELTDLAYDKDGNIEPFFWKTLTDRRMYGNEGQFLEQPNVDLTNLKAETVATFAAPMGERRYNHRVSVTKAAERAGDVSRYSIQSLPDGRKYVKLDGNIFLNEDGSEMSPKEAYRKLVGTSVTTESGDVIRFESRLAGKDLYNEAFRRYPSSNKEEGIDRKALNEQINRNLPEVVITSVSTDPNASQNHEHSGIENFDERTVTIADENAAYDLKLAVANLPDGRKVLYAKQYVSSNPDVFEEIKKAEARRKSPRSQLETEPRRKTPVAQPIDTITQQDDKVKTEIPSINEVPAEKVTEDAPSVPRYSMREEDPNTLKFLNDQLDKGEVVRAYKTFLELVDEDGNVQLYPPMATVQTGADGKRKMANAMAVGAWEKSVGNPNSKNIIYDPKKKAWYYNLVKENGGSVPAAYDPYQHSSNVVLNDQFESAYQRPNLATYEVVIPKSELTSGYHYQDYSLQIGDVSATIDWAAPTALPLFTGAAVHSMIRDGESLEWKDAWDAMMMIAEPMMSLSMLDGLNNVLSSASYADDSQKLATVASSAFTSYLGQAFPTLLGQVARSLDGTRRSTYIDKNSPVPTAIQRFVQSSVQNKIPVWESQKIPYIDVWGREDTNDSKVLGALENFLSPSYINVVNTTDVDETLRELYDKTKENSVLPSQVGKYFSVNGERKDLTPDEYVSYAKDVGSTKYTLLAQLFADPRYMALTDEQKAKAISKIYSYATAVGKYHIDQNYDLHGQGKWMEEANAMPTEIQRFNRIWEYLEEYLSK